MTDQRCLSAGALAAIARGAPARAHDREHLHGCARCAKHLAWVRRVADAGVEQVAASLEGVDALIAAVLAAPRETWWRMVRLGEYQRVDVARRLLSLAQDARWREPQLAIDLLKSATTILDAVPATVEQSDLGFDTWKFFSLVLRESGRYGEAEAAIARAEQKAPTTNDPELASASILVARALLYAEPDVWKPHEAGVLLDRAEQVFSRRAPDRMNAVLTTRAFLLFRSGALAKARDVFERLVEVSGEADEAIRLDALANLTGVRIEMGDVTGDAEAAISHLAHRNSVRGRTVQVARAEWMKGRLNLLRGHYAAAVTSLRAAMSAIGDPDAAIRIGMDAVAGLVLAHRHDEAFDLAGRLATEALALDQREPSRRRALTAEVMAYLREAAGRRMLTADLLDGLARYVDRITRQRPFDFVPPMPLDAM